VSQLTADVAIVTGNLVAGALLAVAGPVPALAVNSATFLASALLLRGLPALVPPASAGRQASAGLALVAAARGLAADRPVAAAAVAATAAAGAATAVESLVVPLSAAVTRQQAWLPGVVLAAISVVTILATLGSPTSSPPARLLTFTLVLTPSGAAVAAALLATATEPSALAGMVLVGLLFVPLVTANVLLAPRIPAGQRASAFGLLMGALAATQAALSGLAGLLADAASPGTAAAVVLCVPVAVGTACLLPIRQLRRIVETDSSACARRPTIESVHSSAASVDDYLAELPPERREWVGRLRAACREELSGYEESMAYGMPSYGRNGTVEVSLASQKQYVALYVMRSDVIDTYRDRLAGLSVGKGCIRYRSPAQVDLDVVRSMLAATAAGGGTVC
jgi:uncharacterized protein YdhG (YjbR/CyaY superfamily)